MLSPEMKAAVREEWRKLGFFYDRDDDTKTWKIVGDRKGIERFIQEVTRFTSDPRNERPSEHEHLGPYLYLKLMSWPENRIDEQGIAGPLSELQRMAFTIREGLLRAADAQKIFLRQSFAPNSEYELCIELRPGAFDAAGEDAGCR